VGGTFLFLVVRRSPQPNHRLQPTPSSLRSYVAAASGRG